MLFNIIEIGIIGAVFFGVINGKLKAMTVALNEKIDKSRAQSSAS